MPTLPIPILSSLILGFLFLRLVLVERRHAALAALLGICAVQGVVIALAQHYGIPVMRIVQPILAACIAPLAWVAFQVTAIRPARLGDIVHLAGPAAAIGLYTLWPQGLDLLIPLLFASYGLAIIVVASRGSDALPRLRLGDGALPSVIWTLMGAALIGSAMTDVLIVLAVLADAAAWRPWIISIYSSAMLLLIGGLSLSGALNAQAEDVVGAEPALPQATEAEAQIVERLNELMRNERLYLDPDLTLTRLSRRLVVPVKQVSAAINKVTGQNVSRYINAARVSAAQDALMQGDPVTSAMLASGFATKSNFNREFLRITGQSPTDWITSRAEDAP